MRLSRFVVAAVAAASMFVAAGAAHARDIRVALDQAFPIRLSEPAEGVAIGNPQIAGVSVQNDRFLFVTGRSYGSTNLVVVGENGRVLYSGRIVVTPDETDVVMVTRGNDTARLECTPLCRPRPDIGDGESSQQVQQQIAGRGGVR
ncbi:MAG: pilus assembly protein N-terminal domain-containing protein [Hyphomonadaceae bacterium]|jgi:Flp pilus assembly secretin CpaC|nr:pilus assembly protein N-terminal domain-containing protein [Hyphomonadaceae bacterium]